MSTDHPDVLDRLAAVGRELDEVAPPISVDEVIRRDRDPAVTRGPIATPDRRRRSLAAAAAGALVAGGVLALVVSSDSPDRGVVPAIGTVGDSESIPSVPSTEPEAAVEPDRGGAPTSTAPETTTSVTIERRPSSVVEQVASLDPWEAAQVFRIDAVYRPSPEESADLTIANELLSRTCLERLGVELDPFDPGRLEAWAAQEYDRWRALRARWTPAGQERLRNGGFAEIDRFDADELDPSPDLTAPAPPQCDPAATSVTNLGGTAVWSETRLDDALLSDPDTTGFGAQTWAFGRLAGTEQADAQVDACLTEQGWSGVDDPQFYAEIVFDVSRSDEALALAIDFADCLVEVDAATIYLSSAADHVDRFKVEFAEELSRIEDERADALAEAYEVLRSAGLDPLSD
ncbi:MAG: hypothetical protein AAF945_16435 [Actinomycetota bacterium]